MPARSGATIASLGARERARLARATEPAQFAAGLRADYDRWLAHVSGAAGCSHPIRLSGTVTRVEQGTGRITSEAHTASMPDGVLYTACGNRRATVCPSCAETYRADTFQLVSAGLVGGKGIPVTVATHPCVFLTVTAPSFGPVHAHRTDTRGRLLPCRPRRDTTPFGEVELGEYGRQWIAEHRCSRRTREEYASLWRLHVEPLLGRVELASLSTERVRTWRAALLDSGRSEDRTAKAYRLLHAVMATAVDDGRVKRNPCRIKGAGQYRTPERPFASVPQVFALRAKLPPRYRTLVLAAAFTGLRWGELIALRRCDVDLTAKVLRVHRSLAQTQAGEMVVGPPKSEAGVRGVAPPDVLVEELTTHVATYAESGPTGLLFTGKRGGVLRRGNFHRETSWTKTVVAVGLPAGFHFHDLRHTGNQLAALSGASTRELMRRMGHASMRAALIYQHASDERDRAIADRLGAHVEQERPAETDEGDDDAAAS